MFKIGLHDPFGHLKHKVWPKEGPRVNLTIWLSITKSLESPWFTCVQVVCDRLLQRSRQGLQLFFRPHFNWRFAHKIMGPQNRESPNFGNFGNPTTKWHLGVCPVVRHRVYYKGEGGGFPQVRAVVSLVSLFFHVVRPCTKSAQTCCLVCASLCEWLMFVISYSPSWNSSMPLYL
jgi:hypothetical protein